MREDRAAIGLLVIAAVIAAIYATGCAGGPLGQATATPNACAITIDASDGGTVNMSGETWLDCRGDARGEQHGLKVDADIDADVRSEVTAGGP